MFSVNSKLEVLQRTTREGNFSCEVGDTGILDIPVEHLTGKTNDVLCRNRFKPEEKRHLHEETYQNGHKSNFSRKA